MIYKFSLFLSSSFTFLFSYNKDHCHIVKIGFYDKRVEHASKRQTHPRVGIRIQ